MHRTGHDSFENLKARGCGNTGRILSITRFMGWPSAPGMLDRMDIRSRLAAMCPKLPSSSLGDQKCCIVCKDLHLILVCMWGPLPVQWVGAVLYLTRRSVRYSAKYSGDVCVTMQMPKLVLDKTGLCHRYMRKHVQYARCRCRCRLLLPQGSGVGRQEVIKVRLA